MAKYKIKFMPEYHSTSLWSVSDSAHDAFGLLIRYEMVSLSEKLIEELREFDARIFELIDWDNPGGECPLSEHEREELYATGQKLLERLKSELGDDFEIIDNSGWIR